MSEEANADAGAGEQPGGETPEAPKTVSHEAFTGVVEQRQKLKSTVRDQAAKLAEYEAREKEAQEAALRSQGENEKIIAARDEALQATAAELQQLKWGIKFKDTVAAVSAKTGLDHVLTEALLLREQQVSGTEVALDELTDDSVLGLAKALKSSAPHMFATKGVGGSPSIPGLNVGNKAEGEMDSAKARVRALAKGLSYQKPQ